MVVDRAARDHLADAIEAYLAGQESGDGVFRRVGGRLGTTADETVRQVLQGLPFEDEDFGGLPRGIDEATKDDWDRLQRILLLLRSDAHLLAETRWRWDRSQLVAAAAVGLFALGAYCLGPVEAYLLSAIPCCWPAWRNGLHREALRSPCVDPRSRPFASRKEVAAVRRRVRGFRIRPFPRELPASPPWTWSERIVGACQLVFLPAFALGAVVLMHVMLLTQLLPIQETTRRVEWP